MTVSLTPTQSASVAKVLKANPGDAVLYSTGEGREVAVNAAGKRFLVGGRGKVVKD